MPLFHRSDRKAKPPSRFSLRKHHRERLSASSSSVGSAGSGPRAKAAVSAAAASPGPAPAPLGPPAKPLQLGLSHSSSRLSASVRSSTSTARSTSPTLIESLPGDAELLGGSDSDSGEVGAGVGRASMAADPHDNSSRTSSSGASGAPTPTNPLAGGRGVRNSLVDYRQLRCSMSYKNRAETYHRAAGSSTISPGHRRSDVRMSELRASMSSSSGEPPHYSNYPPPSPAPSHHHAHAQRGSSRRDGSMDADDLLFLATTPSSTTSAARMSTLEASTSSASVSTSSRPSSADSTNAGDVARPSDIRPSMLGEGRITEANVAAMQTRRAFQQMVLAMKTEEGDSDSDSDDEADESEDDSDSDAFHSNSTTGSSNVSVGGGPVVKLGRDEYRKFQFRLRQLEELCSEQARKQQFMEEAIEREVQARTRKVVAAMEKKIDMYRQAKELECEREIARRVSEMESGSSASMGSLREARSSRRSMMPRQSASLLTPMSRSSGNLAMLGRDSERGKPLDKIFHPRRARRRLEQMREQEEQQKREMEQFREFIRVTEMRSTTVEASREMTASLRQLGDPDLAELLLQAPPADLVDMVCVLRQHVDVQEKQLDEAKQLISAAIEAREEAEATAREAVALTIQLDSRLDRASQEMTWVRDELRQSVLLSPDEMSARTTRVLSAPFMMAPPALPPQAVAASGSSSPLSAAAKSILTA